MRNLKNNKGITMVSLAITIIVLLIVTSITFYNGIGQLGEKRLSNFYVDLEAISTKVAEYYLKNDKLPILENRYANKSELEQIFRENGAKNNVINVNDGEDYYVIDLNKLDNLTLNYGDDFQRWKEDPTTEDLHNIYIINEVTHQVYFPHGIRIKKDFYFTRYTNEKEIYNIPLDEDSEYEWNVIFKGITRSSLENNKVTVVSDVTISGSLEDYDLNTFEFAWSETDVEPNSENLIYTKFEPGNINGNSMDATTSSKALVNSSEYYYFYIKAMNKNGKYSYRKIQKTNSFVIGNLPQDFQRVEFLQSTGTQYINTGFKPNQDTSVEVEYSFTRSDVSYFLYGARTSSTSVMYALPLADVGESVRKLRCDYNNSRPTVNAGYSTNTKYKFKKDKNKSYVDGVYQGESEYSNFTTVCNMYIFAVDNSGTAQAFGYEKIYSFKIWDNNNLIREYIPCYRKSDNKRGLFDLVESKFYMNEGDQREDFIAGDRVVDGIPKEIYDLPAEYQEVEYIESTGTQWINTCYVPKTNTEARLEISFSGPFSPASRNTTIFHSTSTNGRDCFGLNFGEANNQANEMYAWANKSNAQGGPIESFGITDNIKNNKNLIVMKSGSISYGIASRQLSTKEYDNDIELRLLANRKSISDIKTFSVYRAKIYSLQIFEGDILKRYYIPCYRKSDGVKGLYDLVEEVFHTNRGTGDDFIAGDNVNNKGHQLGRLPRDYKKVEYIQSSGTQYIDTNIYFDYTKDLRIIGEVNNPDIDKRKVIIGSYGGSHSVLSNVVCFNFELGSSRSEKMGYFRNYFQYFFDGVGSAFDTYSNSQLPIDTNIRYNCYYNSTDKQIRVEYSYDNNFYSYGRATKDSTVTTDTRPLRLFLDHRLNGSGISNPLKIGKMKIYQDNDLKADYIPCKNSQNVVGMYDLANGEFVTNEGSGEFIAVND